MRQQVVGVAWSHFSLIGEQVRWTIPWMTGESTSFWANCTSSMTRFSWRCQFQVLVVELCLKFDGVSHSFGLHHIHHLNLLHNLQLLLHGGICTTPRALILNCCTKRCLLITTRHLESCCWPHQLFVLGILLLCLIKHLPPLRSSNHIVQIVLVLCNILCIWGLELLKKQ